MFSAVWILLFVSLSVFSVQGLSKNEALSLLEDMEQEVEEHLSGLELLREDGKKRLVEEFERARRNSLARSLARTGEFAELMDESGCPVEVKKELVNIGYSLQDRWGECMNLTEKIIEFENTTLQAYEDFLVWRPVVCKAANNVSLCFAESLFSEVMCVYDSMTGYMSEFVGLKNEVVKLVESYTQLYKRTVNDFKGCFSSEESNIRIKQEKIMSEKCPGIKNEKKNFNN